MFDRSSSDVSVLFHDIRFEIVAAVWAATPLRGGGGGGLSEEAIEEDSEIVRPGI